MKNINKLILLLMVGVVVTSCTKDEFTGHSQLKPTNPTVVINAPAIPAIDYGDAASYSIDISLDQVQIVDVKVHVTVSGDAVEGVDYTLSSSSVILSANGTDIVPILLTVMGDPVRTATRNLTITVGSELTANANVSPVNIDVVFNKSPDNVINPPAAPTADITLWWEFADEILAAADVCDYINDFDVTFQNPGDAGMYDSDLLGFGLASLSCPESGTLTVADMTEGVLYDVWIAIYGGLDLGDAGAMTVHLDFARDHSDFNGSVEIAGVFDSSMGAAGGVFMTIELNGNTLTLKDGAGDVIGEGRVDSNSTLQSVERP